MSKRNKKNIVTVIIAVMALLGFGQAALAADNTGTWVENNTTWCVAAQPADTPTWLPAGAMIVTASKSAKCDNANVLKVSVTKSKLTVRDLPDGTLRVKAGHTALAVVRVTNNNGPTIDVYTVLLPAGDYQFGPGMIAVEGWYNYQSGTQLMLEGCKEANSRFTEATGQGADGVQAWDFGYTVSFDGAVMTNKLNCKKIVSGAMTAAPASGTPEAGDVVEF